MKKITCFSIAFAMHFIARTQNVGVGTTTPAEKLHVVGNIKTDTIKPNAIKLTPNAGAGKLLTSDAEGNANWESLIVPPSNGNVGFGVWGDCATNGNISEYNPAVDSLGVYGNSYGHSVSISGNYAIVGCMFGAGPTTSGEGSASIYQFDGSNWVFMEKLTDPDAPASSFSDHFGSSVGISGNFAIVGSREDDGPTATDQGSASIYQFDGSNWILMEKVFDPAGIAGGQFGYSVAISGNYAIVGSRASQGSASIYQFDGTGWILMEKIVDATGATGDNFGFCVSISGDYVVIGAPYDDGAAGGDQGSASIYHFDGSNWVQTNKLLNSAPAGGDFFGYSVAIYGSNIIVGAAGDDDLIGQQQGSVSFYYFNGTNWVLKQKLIDESGGAGDYLGYSVSISGNYAIAGAYWDDISTNVNQGSGIIFQRLGNTWQKLQHLVDPGGSAADAFGQASAIDDATKRFLIGVPGFAYGQGKVVFGKIN